MIHKLTTEKLPLRANVLPLLGIVLEEQPSEEKNLKRSERVSP